MDVRLAGQLNTNNRLHATLIAAITGQKAVGRKSGVKNINFS